MVVNKLQQTGINPYAAKYFNQKYGHIIYPPSAAVKLFFRKKFRNRRNTFIFNKKTTQPAGILQAVLRNVSYFNRGKLFLTIFNFIFCFSGFSIESNLQDYLFKYPLFSHRTTHSLIFSINSVLLRVFFIISTN